MKIEIPTLDESSAISMDELYTDLTVHWIENKPTGSQSSQLDSYQDLFTDEKTKDTQQHSEPKKDFSKKRVLPLSNNSGGSRIFQMGGALFCRKWGGAHPVFR